MQGKANLIKHNSDISEINRTRVLELARAKPWLNRKEVARELKLSAVTVSKYLNEARKEASNAD